MYLAILIAVLGVGLILFLGIKYENEAFTFLVIPVAVLAAIVSCQSSNAISEDNGKYTIHIGGETVFCREYIMEGELVTVPTHTTLKFDWINHYEYCDTPLVIEVPKGVTLDVHENFQPKARIVSGAVDCTK